MCRAGSITPFASLLALGLPALAQSPDDLERELMELLSTKVTVASKAAESLNAAPGIISVVSRMEIEGFAAQNLGEVLNRVVGMQVLSPDIFPKNSVVLRGQETTPYNNHVLVLLDGRPMRDPITGGLNGSYWNAFPLSVIEKIEIIRGPGSVLYGSCAYSGVVNIVTRTAAEDGLSGQVHLAGGSDGAFSHGEHVVFRQGDLRGIVGLSEFKNQGPTYAFTDYAGTPGSDQFFHRAQGAVAHLTYGGFSLNTYVGNYDPYTLEGGNEIWYANTKSQQTTTHVDLGYTRELNAKVSLGANLTYNRTVWWTGERYVTPAPVYPRQRTEGEALMAEVTARFKPMENLNVILGGGGEKSDYGGDLVVEGDQSSTFLFLQADYRIQALKLIGGMQYNKLEGVDGNLSPRLGLIYDLTEEWGAKVLYSSAFRKGYPNETGFKHPIFLGNQALEPELVDTLEAQVFFQTRTAQASFTYFKSEMKDIITRQLFPRPSPPPGLPPFFFQYLNGGSWDSQGFELEGRVSVAGGLLLTGSISHQSNETEAGAEDVSLHPNTLAKFGALYQTRGWTFSLFDVYNSKPKATTSVRPDSAVVNKAPEAVHLVSAKVVWRAYDDGQRAVKLSLEGHNLLGKDIRYPDYPNKAVNSLIPLSEGRTFYVGASVVF